MTLLQIQYFVDVARLRSFSAAATINFVSQPTISNAISSIEAEIGFQLFIRGKHLELTQDGKEYYYYCKELLTHYNEVCSYRKPINHTIRIGIPPMLSAMMIPEIVSKAADNRIKLHEHYFQDLLKDLKHGAIDLMFHYDSWLVDEPDIMVKVVRPMYRMVSAHRNFNLPRDRMLTAKDLVGLPIALRTSESKLNYLVQQQVIDAGSRANIVCETDQIKTLEMLVRAGICVAFLDKDIFPYDPHVYSYYYEMNGPINVSIFTRKSDSLPQHIQQFIDAF